MKIKPVTKFTPNVSQTPTTVPGDTDIETSETTVVDAPESTNLVQDQETKEIVDTIPDESIKPTESSSDTNIPPINKKEIIVPVKPVDNVSLPVKFMIAYIDEYTKLVTQKIPNIKHCNEVFEKLMRHAIKNQEHSAVLEELYSFFVKKKSILLKPTRVLSGISSSKHGVRERIQIAYMLMYELVSGSKGPFDFEYAVKILEGTGFVSFIKSRLR